LRHGTDLRQLKLISTVEATRNLARTSQRNDFMSLRWTNLLEKYYLFITKPYGTNKHNG
jgi:hypothetical protein